MLSTRYGAEQAECQCGFRGYLYQQDPLNHDSQHLLFVNFVLFKTQLHLDFAKSTAVLFKFEVARQSSSQRRTSCDQFISSFRASETAKGVAMYGPELIALGFFLSAWRSDLCNLRKLESSEFASCYWH